jgi:acylphosphatase
MAAACVLIAALLIALVIHKWRDKRRRSSAPTELLDCEDMMDIQAKRIVVYGRVQGVGFRYFVRKAGLEHGLTGTARNCSDGTVEVIVEGKTAEIAGFLREVERGPAISRVERLEVVDIPACGAYDSFLVEGS